MWNSQSIVERYTIFSASINKDPETGKTIYVPGDMTYDEWYSKYVKGNKKAELEEKKIKNLSADRKQHKQYREVLGDNIPEKLDDFQDMKYNDIEKWTELKSDYRIVNQYNVVSGNVSAKKIVELHEKWIGAKKEFTSKYKDNGNVAYAQFGDREVIAHSKAQTVNNEAYVKYKGDKVIALLKRERTFKTKTINGYDRKLDCEAKIFEHLNSEYGNEKVKLYMNTGFPMCDSCKEVMEQYCKRNPNVQVGVIERKGKNDSKK